MNLSEIDNNMQVEDCICKVEAEMERVLNKHAPIKRKRVTVRKKNPWYNEDIRELKQQLRRKENVFRKYKSKELWLAFCGSKKEYRKALYIAKKKSIGEKIKEFGKNIKELYRLVAELTGTTKKNPLTEASSDEDSAEKFA